MPQFTTPEGVVFNTRAEYREYMIAHHFSVKNKSNITDPIIKKPGDIGGQSFEIADCENCTIVIMDHVSQVVVDNIKGCRLFIGACSGSIFIRNCETSSIHACCQQMRLRDCQDSKIFTFSPSEVHIELSRGVLLGPFVGGYPEHSLHLADAGLDTTASSLWYQVFDHNDPEKSNTNWSLLLVSEATEGAWFPAGECKSALPVPSAGGSHAGEVPLTGQVGQSFGIEQLLLDDAAHKKESSVSAQTEVEIEKDLGLFDPFKGIASGDSASLQVKSQSQPQPLTWGQLRIEVAMLIVSADQRNIPVLQQLSCGNSDFKVSFSAFTSQLTQLAESFGKDEDEETQAELLVAAGPASCQIIASICGCGIDEISGESLIDVSRFVYMCNQKVQHYLKSMDDLDEKDGEKDQQHVHGMSLPSSPYDEEVAFNIEEEEEADTIFDGNRKRTSPKSENKKPSNVFRESSTAVSTATTMRKIQEKVLEQVEAVVKKSDLYHILQVHLGFVESYTIVPARGCIVQSTPRKWLSLREVQDAFLATRLQMNDVHVRAFVTLIKEFAKTEREHAVTEEDVKISRNHVFYATKLNAQWLRRYLLRLRLPHSKSYNAWAEEKDVKSRGKVDGKAKEFERALSGYDHSLTSEEVNGMIEKLSIVPDDFMVAEISRRVSAWVLDTNGRRELKSSINFELRKWQKANPQTPWNRLTEEQRKLIRNNIKHNLTSKHRQNLELSEKNEAKITKDLYWKFDTYRTKSGEAPQSFGSWLTAKYGKKFDEKLEDFKRDNQQRVVVSRAKTERRHSVAALSEVEHKLLEIADSIHNVNHSVELRKSLIALKKSVAESKIQGEGSGLVVTKKVFDKYLENVLAPRLKDLKDDTAVKSLALEARKSHDGLQLNPARAESPTGASQDFLESDLFTTDRVFAEKRASELNKANEEKANEVFKQWLKNKREREAQLKKEKERADKKLAEDKAKKLEDGKKAFKKWLRLRKKNVYISKTEQTIKVIPDVKRADHSTRGWSKDVDLADYYASMENNFL